MRSSRAPLLALMLLPGFARAVSLSELKLTIEPAFGKLTFERPLYVAQPRGFPGRLFVVEQGGRIYSVGGAKKSLFLDLSDKVKAKGEKGLLGLAFHPEYRENGYFYVYYSDHSPRTERRDHQSVLARFKASSEPDRADKGSEEELLRVDQPYENHNGGCLQFGPDGFLYIGLGDGGSAGDPQGHGQDLDTLLGSILRIDVDKRSRKMAYGIPRDNPFRHKRRARPEIWAYGLRNPWRFSFDRGTGELWAGDVGQNKVEEIDIIVRGGNYGWNYFEGTERYAPGAGANPDDFIKPVVDYLQSVGGRSVTGGYVYRGDAYPELYGVYLYGDYTSGYIFGLRYEGGKVLESKRLLASGKSITSFGEDARGELYLTAFDGRVYKMGVKR